MASRLLVALVIALMPVKADDFDKCSNEESFKFEFGDEFHEDVIESLKTEECVAKIQSFKVISTRHKYYKMVSLRVIERDDKNLIDEDILNDFSYAASLNGEKIAPELLSCLKVDEKKYILVYEKIYRSFDSPEMIEKFRSMSFVKKLLIFSKIASLAKILHKKKIYHNSLISKNMVALDEDISDVRLINFQYSGDDSYVKNSITHMKKVLNNIHLYHVYEQKKEDIELDFDTYTFVMTLIEYIKCEKEEDKLKSNYTFFKVQRNLKLLNEYLFLCGKEFQIYTLTQYIEEAFGKSKNERKININLTELIEKMISTSLELFDSKNGKNGVEGNNII